MGLLWGSHASQDKFIFLFVPIFAENQQRSWELTETPPNKLLRVHMEKISDKNHNVKNEAG